MDIDQLSTRIGQGGMTEPDREWMICLNDLMEEVGIDGLIQAGMSLEKARSFTGLLALANRFSIN